MKERDINYSNGMAIIYDELMRDIDYEFWSDFIDDIIQSINPDTKTILELACGTGSFAIYLDELECYDITATDLSPAMIEVANQKGKSVNAKVHFQTMDFRNINIEKQFDAVVMLFDSINYMMTDGDILMVFREVKKVLNDGGMFIFDFTTPVNSIRAVDLLNEERITRSGYHYIRKSWFDEKTGIHYNDFSIEKFGSRQNDKAVRYSELHQERVYTLDQIEKLAKEAAFDIQASYDGFDLIEANENSDRITMVLQ